MYVNILDELKRNGYSLLCDNGYYSKLDGIKPVLFKLNENLYYFKDLTVADKIIGKASAMLLSLSKVKKVYTCVLSIEGKKIFDKYHIEFQCEQLVDYIINRKGDGMCPMEETVKNIDDLNEAYIALNKKAIELSSNK